MTLTRLMLVVAATLAVAAQPAAADDPPRNTLAADLAAAVDLPTPKARAAAASALATRPDVTIAALLDAMRGFGAFAKAAPGAHVETVPLHVMDKVEPTEIHFFVPTKYDPATRTPLLLFLHGAGGDGAEALPPWQGWAERLGMLILAPTEAGANKGYGGTDRERLSVLAALRWARRRWNVDENRIHVTGASRGGHMTWDLALRWPDLFASASPMIGGPRLIAHTGGNNLRFLENVVGLPIRDLQGSKDDPLLLFNLRLAFKRLEALQAKDAKFIEFPDRGHDFDFTAVDWGTFLPGATRDPQSARVVRLASRVGEARAFWVEITKMSSTVTDVVAPKMPAEWPSMSEDAKRLFIEAAAERATARLAVTRLDDGRFQAQGTEVQKFRLLLAEGMFDPAKPVSVTFNGASISRSAKPSKSVLVADFVERFDRTYLPVAEVSIP